MNATNRHGISGGLAGPWEAGVLGGSASTPGNFSAPLANLFGLFYINNDDKLCSFYAAYIFHFFHSFFV